MKSLKNIIRPVLTTILVVGTLDGLAAVIMYVLQTGKDPLNVFRFIASGIFGSEAFSGGVPMALWGILFHYGIAACWTILFFWLAGRFFILTKHWIITGVLYGVFVWLMMNLVVVPLSLVPMKAGPKEWTAILKAIIVLIFCVGLPVAYAAKRYVRNSG